MVSFYILVPVEDILFKSTAEENSQEITGIKYTKKK